MLLKIFWQSHLHIWSSSVQMKNDLVAASHILFFELIWSNLLLMSFDLNRSIIYMIFYLTLFKSSNWFLFMTADAVLEAWLTLQYLSNLDVPHHCEINKQCFFISCWHVNDDMPGEIFSDFVQIRFCSNWTSMLYWKWVLLIFHLILIFKI